MVSACATDPVQLPEFEEAARSDAEVTDPSALPQLCTIPFTATECWQRLEIYDDVAFDNTELAQLNADIARDGEEAYDHILNAAKKQQEIAQIRQEMFEAEKQDHFWDNVWHRAFIFVLGIGLLL